MNILALDTAAEPMSVAVQVGAKVFAYHRKQAKPHDETLLPIVARLLARAGLKVGNLDAVAVASGPGRFTGIRIGMAYAAVLAGQLKIPALALTRFEAAAWEARGEKVCAVVEGFREEKFYQLFKKGRPQGAPVWASPQEWAATRARLTSEGFVFAEDEPTARGLLGPAAAALSRRKKPKFEPLYLKPASYEKKAKPAA